MITMICTRSTVDSHTVDSHTVDRHTVRGHTVHRHSIHRHTVHRHTVHSHTVHRPQTAELNIYPFIYHYCNLLQNDLPQKIRKHFVAIGHMKSFLG